MHLRGKRSPLLPMAFASPIQLLLLVPWAGLAAYLILGRRTITQVPFVELWRGMKSSPRVDGWIQPPPLAVTLVLLSILLAIIASAGPTLRPLSHQRNLVVLVDNGVTLAPAGRLGSLLQDARAELIHRFGSIDVTVVKAVGDDVTEITGSDLNSLSKELTAYPIDTNDLLQTKLARLLQEQEAPVIVLSDRPLKVQNRRVFQISPPVSVANVGIVDLSVREWPLGQVMVRVRNDTALVEAEFEVITGQLDIQRKIALPPPGEVGDYFFDLAEVGAEVKVQLKVPDDFSMDNSASLIRVGAYPRLEVHGDIEPSLRRMVEVYNKNRPPVAESETVVVTGSLFQLPDSRAVAAASSASTLQPLRGPLQVEMNHPILREIDFRSIDRSAVAGASPGDGWTPIVRCNDLVLLAVRETPSRQVWVGFNSASFEATRDFVILWTNILDYLGEGGAQIAYEKLAPLVPNQLPPRQPGIYQRSDGSRVAMNVVDVHFTADPKSLTHLPVSLPATASSAGTNLSPWMIMLAVAGVVLSGLLIKR